jgi:hypothetical protein
MESASHGGPLKTDLKITEKSNHIDSQNKIDLNDCCSRAGAPNLR